MRIQAKTRHTTVIVLPANENVLDFIVGDSEYWHLTGAANLAFLKPIAKDVTTNVALVCESGRIYSFLVTEESEGDPHLIVRVEVPVVEDPRISPQDHQPAFVSRREVAAYQEMAETAMQTVQAVQDEAETRVAKAEAEIGRESEAFRSDYPTRLQFPYRLEDKAAKWPFLVEGIWHDGQFTYLRSNAQETPALWEEKDGQPAMVAYDLQEDGLFIVRHVLGNGWLQIGKQEGQVAFHRTGDRAMSGWKRLYPKPAGSLPGGIVSRNGAWRSSRFYCWSLPVCGWPVEAGETALETAVADVAAPARDFAGSMAAQVEAEAMRAETRRSAAARALQAQQRQEALEAGTEIGAGQVRLDEARLLAGASP